MSYYLQDNPNRAFAQFGWKRTRVSGAIGVHTAENQTDFEGADPGAETVAGWLTRRADPGSYHAIADADSRIKLIHPRWSAWADTTNNAHGMSVAGAMQAARWRELTPVRAAALTRQMAYAAAELVQDALAAGLLSQAVPARRITPAEAIAGSRAGFYGHGETNPGRRYDPGANFDWTLFLQTYASAMGGGLAAQGTTTTTPPEEIDMAAEERIIAAINQETTWAHGRFKILEAKTELTNQLLTALDAKLRFVKGPDDGTEASKTLYEVDGGRLRGISLAEWQIRGGQEPIIVKQQLIDDLLAAAAAADGIGTGQDETVAE